MEEIAIMSHIEMLTNDELSDADESINLDLHVSDTDESEECNTKRSDAEDKFFSRRISAESEDDILNKYVTDSPSPPSTDFETKAEDDSLFPNENDVLLPNNVVDDINDPNARPSADNNEKSSISNDKLIDEDQDIVGEDAGDLCKNDDLDVVCKESENDSDSDKNLKKLIADDSFKCSEKLLRDDVDAQKNLDINLEKTTQKLSKDDELIEKEHEDNVGLSDKMIEDETTEKVNEDDLDLSEDAAKVTDVAEATKATEKATYEEAPEKVTDEEEEEEAVEKVTDEEEEAVEKVTDEEEEPVEKVTDKKEATEKETTEKVTDEEAMEKVKATEVVTESETVKMIEDDDMDIIEMETEEYIDTKNKNSHSDKKSNTSDPVCNGFDDSDDEFLKVKVDRAAKSKLKENKDKLCNGDVHSSDDLSSDSVEKNKDSKKEESEDNEEDLLQVMDEQSVDAVEPEIKDDGSCSSSEKDEDNAETDNNEEVCRDNQEDDIVGNEEDAEETKEIVENGHLGDENDESQIDIDMEEEGECPMDIEESDIGAIIVDQHSKKNTLLDSVNCTDLDDSLINQLDKEANKENEECRESDKTKRKSDLDTATTLVNSICDDILTSNENDRSNDELKDVLEDERKKSNKRQLSADSNEETPKKMRLEKPDEDATIEKPAKDPQKYTLKHLKSFKQYMLDKNLKTLTRFELEELCLQKICECIVNKSEIGELRQKIKVQEQAIDSWRKEAVMVSKQTSDLKIVHERLMTDLKAMKEQSGKPLVPVKITRSVGLQAFVENNTRSRLIMNGATSAPQRTTPVNSPAKTIPARQSVKKPVLQRTLSKPLQTIGQNDASKPRQVQQPVQAKKNADPKAFIDLTDEDEKNQTSPTSAPTNTGSPTVRVINKTPVSANNSVSPKITTNIVTSSAPKIMIMSPSVLARPGGTVMLKVNSNNLVSQANGIIPTVQNGQVSVVTTQPLVRTVQQVRVPNSSATAVRQVAPNKTVYKHPAPLPAPPAIQQNIVAKKPVPPRPHLNLTRSNCGTGIVLQWKMPYKLDMYENIVSYQLYAYQETKSPPRTDNWGKIGDVKALDLPMAVTLTQFAVGNRYFFAVRAVDVLKRLGPFSEPQTILL